MTRSRLFRLVALVLCVIGALVVGFLAWLALAPGPMSFAGGTPIPLDAYPGRAVTGVPVELAGASIIAQGEYLTRAADCAACHTRKDGAPFAGGRAFKLPFGTLYSPNITPDQATGIGAWSDADFLRAVHKGVGKNGAAPILPSPTRRTRC